MRFSYYFWGEKLICGVLLYNYLSSYARARILLSNFVETLKRQSLALVGHLRVLVIKLVPYHVGDRMVVPVFWISRVPWLWCGLYIQVRWRRGEYQ